MKSYARPSIRFPGVAALPLVALLVAAPTRADSVAQVATAKRISRQTVALLDPQGRPAGTTTGSDTVVQPGDILTFLVQFTPVPNGAYRGMGGYITDYIPGNTEVVGARIVDASGNTVRPHRGGLTADGVGPRGPANYTAPLTDGSMSQLYADTGIFYSTDPRTARVPGGASAGEAFLTLKNGLEMEPPPTGVGALGNILGATAPFYAHNAWDLAQVFAFGAANASVNGRGQGNTPEHIGNAGIGYGSPVAGPDSWYQLEATHDTTLGPLAPASVLGSAQVGPWLRIQTTGGEIGRRGIGDTPPSSTQVMPDPGLPARVGIPALGTGGTPLGRAVTPDAPLPRATNAVRFALGELVVGDEYYAEISLRVKALPLDPVADMDLNCAEVMGGDASAMAQDGTKGGKDNVWRYFLPAPACVVLNLLFENRVDRVLAASGTELVYTIDLKNLSTVTQENVVVRDCYQAGDVSIVTTGTTAGFTVDGSGAGCQDPSAEDALVWTVGQLAPGEERRFTVHATATRTTTNRAVYSSDALPTPGFIATAFTTVEDVAVLRLALQATPSAAQAGDTVHYSASVENVGTGEGGLTGCSGGPCYAQVELPENFTYVAGTARVDAAAPSTEPVQTGRILQFTSSQLGASIPAGATVALLFDASIPAGTADGVYPSALSTWVSSAKELEDSTGPSAPVVVGLARSDTPTISGGLAGGATSVSVTTTEGAGSTVTVYVNGNPAGTATAGTSGTVTVTIPTLFGGQHVTATVTATGEVESLPSASVVVSGGAGGGGACTNGLDDDGDGKIDSPDDPGCSSAVDPDETDVPACSNGSDDDGDSLVDFPDDPSCSSYADTDESGAPACSNGTDDDGDGRVDFPDDPGCTSANDPIEETTPACANGADDDGDGFIDYPEDPGCGSAHDAAETEDPAGLPDAGAPDASGAGGAAGRADGGAGAAPPTSPPDLGGLDGSTAAGDASAGDDGGCGCRTGSGSTDPAGGTLLGALLAIAAATRRRKRRT